MSNYRVFKKHVVVVVVVAAAAAANSRVILCGFPFRFKNFINAFLSHCHMKL